MRITVGHLIAFVAVVVIAVTAFLLRPSAGGHETKPAKEPVASNTNELKPGKEPTASNKKELIFHVTPEPWQSSCTVQMSSSAGIVKLSVLARDAQGICSNPPADLGFQVSQTAEPNSADANSVVCRLVGYQGSDISVIAIIDSSSTKKAGTALCDQLVSAGALRLSRKAIETPARTDVLTAIPSIEAYFQDHQSYEGISAEQLRKIDPGISRHLTVSGERGSYCVQASSMGFTVSRSGPNGPIRAGSCS